LFNILGTSCGLIIGDPQHLIKQLTPLYLKLSDLGFELQYFLAFLGYLKPMRYRWKLILLMPVLLLALPLNLCNLTEVKLPQAWVTEQ
jgi:hypothetical protein